MPQKSRGEEEAESDLAFAAFARLSAELDLVMPVMGALRKFADFSTLEQPFGECIVERRSRKHSLRAEDGGSHSVRQTPVSDDSAARDSAAAGPTR